MADHDVTAHDDENYDGTGESGAALTYPMQCSALRKGGHVMLKSHPCKIAEMSTSKTGKHGHAKVNMTGIDIFTGKKYEDISPSTHNMDVPHVTRQEFIVVDIKDDGFISLLDENATGNDNIREDLRLPEGEIGDELRRRFDDGESVMAVVLKAVGTELVIQVKQDNVKTKD